MPRHMGTWYLATHSGQGPVLSSLRVGVRTPAGQWSPDTAGTPTWSHPHLTWSLSSQSCHCKHVSFQAHCTSLLMLLLAIQFSASVLVHRQNAM